jgi:hypothetical protein
MSAQPSLAIYDDASILLLAIVAGVAAGCAGMAWAGLRAALAAASIGVLVAFGGTVSLEACTGAHARRRTLRDTIA